jgi:hypothetical protein
VAKGKNRQKWMLHWVNMAAISVPAAKAQEFNEKGCDFI